MATKAKTLSIFDPTLLGPAVGQAFAKLDPRQLVRNPVIFVTEVVAVVVTLMFALDVFANIGQAVFSGLDELISAMDRDSRKAREALAAARPLSELDARLGFLR